MNVNRDSHLCDLVMVMGVTSTHKGLATSRLIDYLAISKDAHTGHT